MTPPAIDRIIAEFEAGLAAIDDEIKLVEDRRVDIVGITIDMRRRLEALARSRFVLAEQLAQLKAALASQKLAVIPCAPQREPLGERCGADTGSSPAILEDAHGAS